MRPFFVSARTTSAPYSIQPFCFLTLAHSFSQRCRLISIAINHLHTLFIATEGVGVPPSSFPHPRTHSHPQALWNQARTSQFPSHPGGCPVGRSFWPLAASPSILPRPGVGQWRRTVAPSTLRLARAQSRELHGTSADLSDSQLLTPFLPDAGRRHCRGFSDCIFPRCCLSRGIRAVNRPVPRGCRTLFFSSRRP